MAAVERISSPEIERQQAFAGLIAVAISKAFHRGIGVNSFEARDGKKTSAQTLVLILEGQSETDGLLSITVSVEGVVRPGYPFSLFQPPTLIGDLKSGLFIGRSTDEGLLSLPRDPRRVNKYSSPDLLKNGMTTAQINALAYQVETFPRKY